MSTSIAIFISILTGLICFFIGKNWKSKKDQDWKGRFDESDKKLKSMTKLHKKSMKKSQQLEQQHTSAQQQLKEIEEKYIPLNESLNLKVQSAQAEIVTLQSNFEKQTADLTYLTHQHEKLKKERSRLNDKYATDLKASKGWANRKISLDNEIETLKERLLTSRKENLALQKKLDAQVERMQEVSKFAKEFRIMKSANRKLTKDLAYWEQKQFETNHDLAASVKEVETLKTEREELILRFKGTEIIQKNMLNKIEEFKSKFVNVNNLYHELKAEKNMN